MPSSQSPGSESRPGLASVSPISSHREGSPLRSLSDTTSQREVSLSSEQSIDWNKYEATVNDSIRNTIATLPNDDKFKHIRENIIKVFNDIVQRTEDEMRKFDKTFIATYMAYLSKLMYFIQQQSTDAFEDVTERTEDAISSAMKTLTDKLKTFNKAFENAIPRSSITDDVKDTIIEYDQQSQTYSEKQIIDILTVQNDFKKLKNVSTIIKKFIDAMNTLSIIDEHDDVITIADKYEYDVTPNIDKLEIPITEIVNIRDEILTGYPGPSKMDSTYFDKLSKAMEMKYKQFKYRVRMEYIRKMNTALNDTTQSIQQSYDLVIEDYKKLDVNNDKARAEQFMDGPITYRVIHLYMLDATIQSFYNRVDTSGENVVVNDTTYTKWRETFDEQIKAIQTLQEHFYATYSTNAMKERFQNLSEQGNKLSIEVKDQRTDLDTIVDLKSIYTIEDILKALNARIRILLWNYDALKGHVNKSTNRRLSDVFKEYNKQRTQWQQTATNAMTAMLQRKQKIGEFINIKNDITMYNVIMTTRTDGLVVPAMWKFVLDIGNIQVQESARYQIEMEKLLNELPFEMKRDLVDEYNSIITKVQSNHRTIVDQAKTLCERDFDAISMLEKKNFHGEAKRITIALKTNIKKLFSMGLLDPKETKTFQTKYFNELPEYELSLSFSDSSQLADVTIEESILSVTSSEDQNKNVLSNIRCSNPLETLSYTGSNDSDASYNDFFTKGSVGRALENVYLSNPKFENLYDKFKGRTANFMIVIEDAEEKEYQDFGRLPVICIFFLKIIHNRRVYHYVEYNLLHRCKETTTYLGNMNNSTIKKIGTELFADNTYTHKSSIVAKTFGATHNVLVSFKAVKVSPDTKWDLYFNDSFYYEDVVQVSGNDKRYPQNYWTSMKRPPSISTSEKEKDDATAQKRYMDVQNSTHEFENAINQFEKRRTQFESYSVHNESQMLSKENLVDGDFGANARVPYVRAISRSFMYGLIFFKRVCPVNNIRMIEGQTIWTTTIHQITYENLFGKKYKDVYRNPGINVRKGTFYVPYWSTKCYTEKDTSIMEGGDISRIYKYFVRVTDEREQLVNVAMSYIIPKQQPDDDGAPDKRFWIWLSKRFIFTPNLKGYFLREPGLVIQDALRYIESLTDDTKYKDVIEQATMLRLAIEYTYLLLFGEVGVMNLKRTAEIANDADMSVLREGKPVDEIAAYAVINRRRLIAEQSKPEQYEPLKEAWEYIIDLDTIYLLLVDKKFPVDESVDSKDIHDKVVHFFTSLKLLTENKAETRAVRDLFCPALQSLINVLKPDATIYNYWFGEHLKTDPEREYLSRFEMTEDRGFSEIETSSKMATYNWTARD